MASNPALELIRRQQILDAALQVFSEKGIHNVTMNDIAREAGLSKGGVAHYFQSKEDLVKSAFKEFFDRIFERAKTIRDQHEDPLAQVLSYGWIYNRQDPDISLGYRLIFDSMALASLSPEYRSIFHEWVENWIRLLRESLKQGMQQGVFRVRNTDGAARTISAIYHGIAVRWALDETTHTDQWADEAFRAAITSLLGIEKNQ